MEPVILGRAVDPGDALVDVAGELGVRHVLVASGPASARRRRRAVRHAVRPSRSRGRHRGAGVPSHLHHRHARRRRRRRAGGESAQRRRAGRHPPPGPLRRLARGPRARSDHRCCPTCRSPTPRPSPRSSPATCGTRRCTGGCCRARATLPLAETLAAVPSVPLSVELRSRPLMERFPDPTERAQRGARRHPAARGPGRSAAAPGAPAQVPVSLATTGAIGTMPSVWNRM